MCLLVTDHPNIKTDSGEICADVIGSNWSPTLNVRHVLKTILQVICPHSISLHSCALRTNESCPMLFISTTVPARKLLEEPNTENPLEAAIAQELTDDPEKFKASAKAHTEEFAM